MTPQLRTALYAVALAALAVATAYGLVTQDTADLWATLIERLLTAAALILAIRHVPAAPDAKHGADED